MNERNNSKSDLKRTLLLGRKRSKNPNHVLKSDIDQEVFKCPRANCNFEGSTLGGLNNHITGKYIFSKNTGAWKGKLKGFFVDPYAVELAKNGTNIT